MRRFGFLSVIVVVTCLAGTLAHGGTADQIGIVKSVAGEVQIVRDGRTVPAQTNQKLYQEDVVETGPDGKAGLILADDTVVSLGPGSRFAVKQFEFQPREKKLSLIARIIRGTVSFISGQIAKLAPKKVRVETPSATVGVRGTHLLIRVE